MLNIEKQNRKKKDFKLKMMKEQPAKVKNNAQTNSRVNGS